MSLHVYDDLIQGTDEWLEARRLDRPRAREARVTGLYSLHDDYAVDCDGRPVLSTEAWTPLPRRHGDICETCWLRGRAGPWWGDSWWAYDRDVVGVRECVHGGESIWLISR